jgi:hypothetical protein
MISNIEKELKERMRMLQSLKDIKYSDLADTKSERVMVGRQFGENDTTVPFRTLYKILYAYHDVSAEWLILGEGSWQKTKDCPKIFNQQHYEMQQNGENNQGNINVGNTTIPYPVQAMLDEKDKRIADLEEDKRRLNTIIDALTVKPRK